MEQNRSQLTQLARQAMQEWGLEPDYSRDAVTQLQTIQGPAEKSAQHLDLRNALWVSIDNDDSRDLDQLTFAQKEADGAVSIWVAIADVDALVAKDTPIDMHAQVNTTTVYTPSINFPMLPEKLSTNLTSLNESEDRASITVKMTVNQAGDIIDTSIHQAVVYNHAKLTYRAVGNWLEGNGPIPPKIAARRELEDVLRLQSTVALAMRKKRYNAGALTLERPEPHAVFKEDQVVGIEHEKQNLAHQLIEEFMIGANWTLARDLTRAKVPSFRRIVRIPKRWDRIVAVAKEMGETLPLDPDSKALDRFLVKMQHKDPKAFPDLSLTIIKLLGSGEYIVEMPGDVSVGHFGLALRAYTHATAPNRRYPDIITQRQIKAHLFGNTSGYQVAELEILARHCTLQEDAATKVERRLNKSAAALLLSSHIGEEFQGIVTGAAEKGTWVRLFAPPVDGKVVQGMQHLDVGHRIRVKLLSVDVTKGYIDFARL